MSRVSDRIRRQLLNFSRRQREGMDFLVRLIWCECKEGNPTKSKSWEDWCDIEMDWYGAANGGTPDKSIHKHGYGTENDCYQCFNTPRRGLKREWLEVIQEFIDTHTFRDITQARREIADDLLNACCSDALNIVHELYYWPAERKKENEATKKFLDERERCRASPPKDGRPHVSRVPVRTEDAGKQLELFNG